MRIWVPRWYLEDLGLEVVMGEEVSWEILPADREWYGDMLGSVAPLWEINAVDSDALAVRSVSGVVVEICVVAPDMRENSARSATERWPAGATTQKVGDTSKVEDLDISLGVTGFVIDLEISQ